MNALRTPPPEISDALAAPVAVFGGGVSGRGVLRLLERLGATGVAYDAAHGNGVPFDAVLAGRHRMVVSSPGFSPGHPWVVAARQAGVPVLGETDFAGLFWPGRVLAVTGTNGKTTLTEFLSHALTRIGRRAVPAGNVGDPLSRLAADARAEAAETTAVCEVSSFQAETLVHLAPDGTLWTNFAEDHLERHGTMESYFRAKWRLVERTGNRPVVAGAAVVRQAAALGLAMPPALVTASEPLVAGPAGTLFDGPPQDENYSTALSWWRHAGLPAEALEEAARTFRVGGHRLAPVVTAGGITFWNDSKATNFHAVEGALRRFDRPVHWIAGGRSKGGDIAAFVVRIGPRIRHAWLIGETAGELAAGCAAAGVPHTLSGTLESAVNAAAAAAAPGEHVLLSPAFASFDQFRSYEDRGRRFEEAARKAAATLSLT